MSEVCTDNRYEVIAAYKKKLMERTNIETSPDEMAVIDNVLFRFWQLGWLPPVPHGRLIDAETLIDAIIAKYIRHERHRELVFTVAQIKQDMADIINELPTIIPAEEVE